MKKHSRETPKRNGVFTAIDLLAGVFVLSITVLTCTAASHRFGYAYGILAAISIGFICVSILRLAYKHRRRHFEKVYAELTENYPLVYRVASLPNSESTIIVAKGAEINIGDFAWSAEAIHPDGLIYLHGLNKRWHVVWYAGFEIGQIEAIGRKPVSQYFLPYHWRTIWAEVPLCPFTVKDRTSNNLGLPTTISYGYAQGVKIPNKRKRG